MRLALPQRSSLKIAGISLHVPRARTLGWMALAAIIALAAGLRFANLEAIGEANHYYTAAVASMLQSWHNFFFVAAEPGASVTVDKPPLGLWIQAVSASFLGVNGFAVVLPQIIAGILSVLMVYHLVRRSFGTPAGLLAALALTITPIVVATDRNNTIDSTLILTLLLAAWAFIKAAETTKFRYLLLGAFLVGMGFNIKMLQAYLPLPAFLALYILGSTDGLWRKVGKLALASLLLLVVSLSWALAVDLTPADQRPYVGSSGDNSELSLITGYNGLNRLLGMFGRPGGGPSVARGAGSPGAAPARDGAAVRPRPDGGVTQPWQGAAPAQPGTDGSIAGYFNRPPVTDGAQLPSAPAGGFPPGAPGGMNNGLPRQDGPAAGAFPGRMRAGTGGGPNSGTGQPGALRLFTPPLSKEVSWLLPFGLVSALLLLFSARLRWPLARQHQALVLWGGWLLVGGVFFSVAGFFHEYYLSMLAPPLAALVGIGAVQFWDLRARRPWLVVALLLVTVGGTLAFQATTAQAFISSTTWLGLALACFAAGSALLIAATVCQKPGRLAVGGFTCLVAAILVTPGTWSGLTAYSVSANQSLPSAYSGGAIGTRNLSGLQVNQALLDYLQANTQGTEYLMAVPSSMQGADYVLASGRPVLYLGGFNGMDQVVSTDELEKMVSEGRLRYIYWDTRGAGGGGRSDISSWVTSTCQAVQGFETATRNQGAPDGTVAGSGAITDGRGVGFSSGMGGSMQVSLYDCYR